MKLLLEFLFHLPLMSAYSSSLSVSLFPPWLTLSSSYLGISDERRILKMFNNTGWGIWTSLKPEQIFSPPITLWLISHMLFANYNKLFLRVSSGSGNFFEKEYVYVFCSLFNSQILLSVLFLSGTFSTCRGNKIC